MDDDIVNTFSFLLCRFGGSVEVLHALDQPFSPVSGGFILQNLAFTQTRTNFVQVQWSPYNADTIGTMLHCLQYQGVHFSEASGCTCSGCGTVDASC